MIIITKRKSHNNYCSVGVMELCLLNLLILIVFCVILTLVCSLRACHMWLTRNHMFIHEIWEKFTSFIFWIFFQKSELAKFISNFPLNHVITSTNKYNTPNFQVFYKFPISKFISRQQSNNSRILRTSKVCQCCT